MTKRNNSQNYRVKILHERFGLSSTMAWFIVFHWQQEYMQQDVEKPCLVPEIVQRAREFARTHGFILQEREK